MTYSLDKEENKEEAMSVKEYQKKVDALFEPLMAKLKKRPGETLRKNILSTVEKMIYTEHKIFDKKQGTVVPMSDSLKQAFALNTQAVLGGGNKNLCEMEFSMINIAVTEIIRNIDKRIADKKSAEKRRKIDEVILALKQGGYK